MESYTRIILMIMFSALVCSIPLVAEKKPVESAPDLTKQKQELHKLIDRMLDAKSKEEQETAVNSFRQAYLQMSSEHSEVPGYFAVSFDERGKLVMETRLKKDSVKFVIVMESGAVSTFDPFHITVKSPEIVDALLRPR